MKSLLILLLFATTTFAADYPVAFLAYPLDPAVTNFRVQSFAESNGPYLYHVGTDLMVIEPDGTERVLVAGQQGDFLAVHDYGVSLDGQSIYYSHIHSAGKYADIYRIPVAGGAPVQLTNAASEWNPPSGVYPVGSDGPVWNTAPCDTPEGIVFTSSRNNIKAPGEGFVAFLMYAMDHDGNNLDLITPMSLGGVLHPSYFRGRIYFSSNEIQGHRGGMGGHGNGWAIWSIKFDGTDWKPELSMTPPVDNGWHNTAHSSDGTLLADYYYDTRAIGRIDAVPPMEPSPFGDLSPFNKPISTDNPFVWDGWNTLDGRVRSGNFRRFSFSRVGQFGLLPWAKSRDNINTSNDGGIKHASPDDTYYQREVGHPSGTPGNGVLITWTGDKPTHRDWGIYLVPDAAVKFYPTDTVMPSDRPLDYFTKVVDREDRHEWYGKAIASYLDIYGSNAPAMSPSAVVTELPEGTPYGIIGSSNIKWREITTADGKQLINIPDADVAAIRILSFNATTPQRIAEQSKNIYGASGRVGREGFSSAINERTGYYETLIPIESDGSFKAAIPADQPWTFQLLGRKGEALSTAQTWHQVRPGESRTDCRGCHAHHQPAPERFEDQIAGQPGYQFVKLDKIRTVEYERDIREIDERLSLGLGNRPWAVADGPVQYGSATWDITDDPRLTDAEARTLRAWADTGFMAATRLTDGTLITPEMGLGPYADMQPPTLALTTLHDRTLIGATDPQAGLLDGSLSVTSSEPMAGCDPGQELADLFVRDGDVWTLNAPAVGTVTVSIRDAQAAVGAEVGNETRIIRVVEQGDIPQPPEPQPCDDLLDEIEALEAEIESLKATLEAWRLWHKAAPITQD